MNLMLKVFVVWCWTTWNSIQQIESQYHSMWQQQQQQQYYQPQLQQQQEQHQLPPNQRQQRALVKISARGFLPFENDILPYAVLQRILDQQEHQRQLEHQLRREPQQFQQYSSSIDYDRGGRYMQWQTGPQPKNLLAYAKHLQSTKVRATINKHNQRHQSSFTKAQTGIQYYNNNPKWLKSKKLKLQRTSDKFKHYKLYDADGEYLLDLRYHNNDGANNNNHNNNNDDNSRLVADNEWSADTKNVRKIMPNINGIGMALAAATTTFDESQAKKAVNNYNNSGNIDEPNNNINNENNNHTASTFGKSTPIVVEDIQRGIGTMPTSPVLPTIKTTQATITGGSKNVQHIWLHL